jgi:predicted nucleic acid-binding protein
VSLLVDTSVWSLALRRDVVAKLPEVQALAEALAGSRQVVTTGLVLQELLQGFSGPKAKEALLARFSALASIQPDRDDHIAAAELRNTCRRRGVQVGTIDGVLMQLALRYELTLLSTDGDFAQAARHVPFSLWRPS